MPPTRLEIDLLGRFAVRHDGEEVAGGDFGGQLAQRLVRLLVIRRGEVTTREALIDSLWGGQPPADPEANLNVVVNRARRALGDATFIETVAGGYAFSSASDVVVDVEAFEAHLQTAREETRGGHPRRSLRAAESALSLWRGGPLPEDSYAEWAQPHRDRLERGRQAALELGAAAALEAGRIARASDLAAEAVSCQPLREAAHVLHMRALASAGDTAGALAAYDALRRRLVEELGIDPSREAAEIYEGLLRGEPVSELETGLGAGAAHRATPPTAPFVGRQGEIARLFDLEGRQRVGLLSGSSGSGKSRLLEEVAARTDRPVLSARALLPEREAPWSLARTLLRAAVDAGADPDTVLAPRSQAALVELLPELGTRSATIDRQSRRALALDGAVKLLSALGDTLLIVDDLQWADASSLGLLAVLASRVDDLMIILAYRPEEIAPGHEVAQLLADLRATAQPPEIVLGPLDASAVERLVDDVALAGALAGATDGTPFAILEVLRTLEQHGAVRRDGRVWRTSGADVVDRARTEARAGQRRLLAMRADRQPRGAQELLAVLALLGRPAPASLLAEATGGTPQEVTIAMKGLARAGLVRHDEQGWATAHDLVGDTVKDRLDPTDRARLHQLLARALDGEDVPAERAHHLAGAGDRPAAAAAYAAAARQQLDHFADREAERLAEAGLALGPSDRISADLLEVRAETRVRAGDLSQARDDLRAGLRLVDARVDRSRLLTRLAGLASGAQDLIRAANLVDLALAEAGDDTGARARALAVAAIIDMNLQRPERAEARYAEALALFEQVRDARGVADVLDARAMATFLDGDIASAVFEFDRVAQLFADAGDLLRVVTPRSTRGHGLVFAGSPTRGLADTDEALELARSLGNPEGQTYAQWHRSEALTACGRATDGAAAATDALAIAERLDHRGWTATALLALGIACQADGDVQAAEDALRRSLRSSEHLPLFACWAHARLALVLVSAGRLDDAESHVTRALATGPPLGHYEARLAQCELAVARSQPNAAALIADALDRAVLGGHHASSDRLMALRRR